MKQMLVPARSATKPHPSCGPTSHHHSSSAATTIAPSLLKLLNHALGDIIATNAPDFRRIDNIAMLIGIPVVLLVSVQSSTSYSSSALRPIHAAIDKTYWRQLRPKRCQLAACDQIRRHRCRCRRCWTRCRGLVDDGGRFRSSRCPSWRRLRNRVAQEQGRPRRWPRAGQRRRVRTSLFWVM